MSFYVNHDDNIIKAEQPIVNAGNRGLRYGDGLFETMKMTEGKIPFLESHLERLFQGMLLLGFEPPVHFTQCYLENKIYELSRLNDHTVGARVRLMIYRGNGSLYEPEDFLPHYIIETVPFTGTTDTAGITAGIYDRARKAIDEFSHIKSNNYQPYAMAALHARKMGWTDGIVLNTQDNVCESSISNIFVIKNGIIITPSLSQGCIAGIMRKHLLQVLPARNFEVREDVVTVKMLQDADEVFLTNAVQGIRWVSVMDSARYDNTIINRIKHAISR